jgi:hypothetical protein
MSVFQFFVNSSELVEIIRLFADRRGLGGYLLGPQYYTPFDPINEPQKFLGDPTPRFILVPKANIESSPVLRDNVSDAVRGNICVRPGLLKNIDGRQVLEETDFLSKDHKDLDFSSSYWIRAFKKDLIKKQLLTFGATGFRLADDKQGYTYKALGYSKGALDLFNSGVKWQEFKTDLYYYAPVKTE